MMRKLENVYNQFFNKKSFILFLVVILPIIYKTKVEKFLTDYVVQPLLSDFPSNTLVDVVLIIVNVLIVTYYSRKLYIKYIASPTAYLIFGIVTGWYIFYRFIDSSFEYIPFSFLDKIFYADTLLTAFLFYTILTFINLTSRTKNSQNEGFYSDDPIIYEKDDLLGRRQYAEELAKEIEKTHHPKSFAVGIIGRWGSGKTSFLNMVKSRFKDSDHIIVEFNPWNSSNSKLIIQDFFDTLKVNVGRYSSSLSNQFIEYSEKLIAVESNLFTKAAKVGLGFLKKEKTAHEKYSEINKTIQKLNRKIIVFIDDLDRLDKDEIIEVIKLIRNTANFSSTVFVVAYDRDYVLNAIKELNDYNKEIFLEKIFQLEITLPYFEETQIKKRLESYLKNKIFEEHENEQSREDLDNKINEAIFQQSSPFEEAFIDECIRTVRDASRFANSLLFSYRLLKGEVQFIDLFNIELIKVKYPSIYVLLYEEKHNFFNTRDPFSWNEDSGYILKSTFNNNSPNSTSELEDYMNKHYLLLNIPENQITKIIKAIKDIFQPNRIDRSKLSIIYPSSFDRYFAFRLFDGNLSEVEFSNYRRKSEKEFIEKIKFWVDDKNLEWPLRRKFKRITGFDNREDYEKVVKGMLFLSRKNFLISKDYPLDFKILFQYFTYRDIIEKYYGPDKDDFKSFVQNIFEQAEPPYLFESLFLYVINTQQETESFILGKTERETIVLKYLQDHLNSIEKIDKAALQLYRNCRIVNPKNADERIVLKRANRLFKDFALKKDFQGFCIKMITSKSDSFEYKISYKIADIATNVFNSYEKFGECLEQYKDENGIFKEFYSFYIKCKEHGFPAYIDFEFKIIQI